MKGAAFEDGRVITDTTISDQKDTVKVFLGELLICNLMSFWGF